MPRARTTGRLTLSGVAVTITGLYVISLMALAGAGLRPAIPWSFAPFLVLVSLPQAVVLIAPACVLSPRVQSIWTMRAIGLGAGLLVARYSSASIGWVELCLVIAALAPFATRSVGSPDAWGRTLLAAATLIAGYGIVWNANELVVLTTPGRLINPWLAAFDLRLWGAAHVTYPIFPAGGSKTLLAMIERSYLFLFSEILTITLWAAWTQSSDALARWLAALFSAYGVGLAMFLAAPSIGPLVSLPPDLLPQATAAMDPGTRGILQSINADYHAVLAHGSLEGFAYFIALPSLHVAAAVLGLLTARVWRFLFYALLPVSLLLITSTVVLGFHYILDVPAGILVALAVWWLWTRGCPRLGFEAPRPAKPPRGWAR